MALIDQSGFTQDTWSDIDDDAPLAGERRVLVSLARYVDSVFGEQSIRHLTIGLRVPNDTAAPNLTPYLNEIELIAIDFPGSADGRGFSLARQLRRLGFAGELRACGPLISDQFAFAMACGFDTVQVPDSMAARQPEVQWREALGSIDSRYQAHYASAGQSILEQRMAARRSQMRKTLAEGSPDCA
jgi:uncharacterized protein (DUF934 family)